MELVKIGNLGKQRALWRPEKTTSFSPKPSGRLDTHITQSALGASVSLTAILVGMDAIQLLRQRLLSVCEL